MKPEPNREPDESRDRMSNCLTLSDGSKIMNRFWSEFCKVTDPTTIQADEAADSGASLPLPDNS
jgi:hypothetical protein